MSQDPPIHWLHVYFSAFNNGPDGALFLKKQTINLMGTPVPQYRSDYLISQQNNLLGGYPTEWDVAPSVTFAVIFFAFAVIHLLIWRSLLLDFSCLGNLLCYEGRRLVLKSILGKDNLNDWGWNNLRSILDYFLHGSCVVQFNISTTVIHLEAAGDFFGTRC